MPRNLRKFCWLLLLTAFCRPTRAEDICQVLIDHFRGGTWARQTTEETPNEDTYTSVLDGRFTLFTGRSPEGRAVAVIGKQPNTDQWFWWMFRESGVVEKLKFVCQRDNENDNTFRFSIGDRDTNSHFEYSFEKQPDIAHLTGKGRINGRQPLATQVTWKRGARVDDLWLYSDPPTDNVPQLTIPKRLTGPKWLLTDDSSGRASGASHGRWVLGGKFQLYQSAKYGKNGSAVKHLIIAGKDSTTGKYGTWEFNSQGTVGRTTFSPDGMSLTGAFERSQPAPISMTFRGRFQSTETGVTYHGMQTAGDAAPVHYTWAWRDAEPPSFAAQRQLQQLGEFMAGTWTHTDKDGNYALHRYSWSLGNRFLKTSGRIDPFGPWEGHIGIAPETGKVTWWAYMSSGTTTKQSLISSTDSTWTFAGPMHTDAGRVDRVLTITKTGEASLAAVVEDTSNGSTTVIDRGIWHRAAPVAADEIRPPVDWRTFEGVWEFSSNSGERATVVSLPALNGNVGTAVWNMGDEQAVETVVWDVHKRVFIVNGYGNGKSNWNIEYKLLPNGRMRGPARMTFADGRKATGTMTFRWVSETEARITADCKYSNGEPLNYTGKWVRK